MAFVSHLKDFKLKFEYKDEDKIKWYSLKYPLMYQSKHGLFTVPRDTFLTDVASIPTFFQSVFKPLGKYSRSSVLHDYIVDDKALTYYQKHKIYLDAMLHDNVTPLKAYTFFYAVLGFYWLHKIMD